MADKTEMMSYLETAELLQQYDIALPPSCWAETANEAVTAAAALGYPVVLKAISPDLSHKSDRGLVKLGLTNEVSLRKAMTELLTAVQWGQEAALEGILVQKMLPPGVEMIAGIHRDSQFGPLVVLGSGGVLVELLDDAVLRLPPLTTRQAMLMIQETRSYPLLRGYRHFPPADIPDLAQLLVKLSRLAADNDHIASLDLNPVLVLPHGQGLGLVDLRAEFTKKERA